MLFFVGDEKYSESIYINYETFVLPLSNVDAWKTFDVKRQDQSWIGMDGVEVSMLDCENAVGTLAASSVRNMISTDGAVVRGVFYIDGGTVSVCCRRLWIVEI